MALPELADSKAVRFLFLPAEDDPDSFVRAHGPEAFEALRTLVVAPLLAQRVADEEIRVWVPGCSSGEEAYSIAMLFAEAARTAGEPLAVQIFATDLDVDALIV